MIATAARSGRNTFAGLADQLAADDGRLYRRRGLAGGVGRRAYLKMNGRRRLVGSFNHGTMACALPHAIGAQTAFRKPSGGRAGR